MEDLKLSKVSGVIKGILIFLLVFIVINIPIVLIQTVAFYTAETKDGDEIVVGFDRGFGGVFSSWKFNVDKNNNMTIKKKDTEMLKGYLSTSEYVLQTKESLQQASIPIIKSDNANKLEYVIYNDDGMYYYLATFEKLEDIGIVAWSTSQMSNEDAIDMFERIRATKGIGYYISCACSEALDLMGD